MPETISFFSNYVAEFCSSDVKLRRDTEMNIGKDNGKLIHVFRVCCFMRLSLYSSLRKIHDSE